MSRCKFCKKRIKWMSVYDNGFVSKKPVEPKPNATGKFEAHACDKQPVRAPVKKTVIDDPWWDK